MSLGARHISRSRTLPWTVAETQLPCWCLSTLTSCCCGSFTAGCSGADGCQCEETWWIISLMLGCFSSKTWELEHFTLWWLKVSLRHLCQISNDAFRFFFQQLCQVLVAHQQVLYGFVFSLKITVLWQVQQLPSLSSQRSTWQGFKVQVVSRVKDGRIQRWKDVCFWKLGAKWYNATHMHECIQYV